jgi:hypothetical protein
MHPEEKVDRSIRREKKIQYNRLKRNHLSRHGDPITQKCTNYKCREYRENKNAYANY